MTAADWKYLEDNYSLFNPVKIVCDGFKITLQKSVDKKQTKIYNVVIVNEEFKGEWIDNSDTFPQSKYLYPRTFKSKCWTKKYQIKFKKRFGKEALDNMMPSPVIVRTPFFPSFKAFKQHIIKTCKEIEIIRD